jgi:hypothetical protein
MKNLTITGVILIIVGVVLLVYQGFTFTREKKVIDVGPIQATATTHERVPIPPIIGWVVTAGGLVLLVTGLTRSRAA